MIKIHLIKTSLNGSSIGATAVMFDEQNNHTGTQEITFEESNTASDILSMLSFNEGEVYETHVRGGGIKRKK